jgi:hypothetical protein
VTEVAKTNLMMITIQIKKTTTTIQMTKKVTTTMIRTVKIDQTKTMMAVKKR